MMTVQMATASTATALNPTVPTVLPRSFGQQRRFHPGLSWGHCLGGLFLGLGLWGLGIPTALGNPYGAPATDSPASPSQPTPTTRSAGPDAVPTDPAAMSPMTPDLVDAILQMENHWQQEYENYLNLPNLKDFENPGQVILTLNEADRLTGTRTGFLWIAATPEYVSLILTTAEGVTVERRVPVSRDRVMQVVRLFHIGVADIQSPPGRYLRPAQQLYDWLVAPIEAELEAEGIDTLIFCMGKGLRSLPVAALHDGEKFLVERYAPVRVPAFALSNFAYQPLQGSRVLAMGASEFTDQSDLPAVPLEVTTITEQLWPGLGILNEDFTLKNLREQRQRQPYEIIHLATHANFEGGDLRNSYIQLWDERLTLDRIPDMNWSQPPVDLLVLSACETALGDAEAELGFAGLTVQAGVKSVLASLWSVSDVGTLALMTEFYSHLRQADSKADALRDAQLSMIRGEVTVADGVLRGSLRGQTVLAEETLEQFADLSHPFYWSAFTIVGSPW